MTPSSPQPAPSPLTAQRTSGAGAPQRQVTRRLRPAYEPPPDTRPLHRAHLVGLCRRGEEPLESLAVAGMYGDRDRLLSSWLRAGWSVAEIAQHTRSTTYTIGRLVGRLHVHTNPRASKGAA